MMSYAKREGRQAGFDQGLQEGLEQGLEQGVEQSIAALRNAGFNEAADLLDRQSRGE